jgi:hypothetical protein
MTRMSGPGQRRLVELLDRLSPPAVTSRSPVIDLAAALRPTRGDAVAVLLLRCLRTVSWVLLAVGLAVAIRTGSTVDPEDFATPSALLESILSPLAVLATGVLVRVLLTPIAWSSAFVVALRSRPRLQPGPRRPSSPGVLWLDLARVADGLRALRWTTAARDGAVSRLGRWGTGLLVADYLLKGVLTAAWAGVVVVLLTAGTATGS